MNIAGRIIAINDTESEWKEKVYKNKEIVINQRGDEYPLYLTAVLPEIMFPQIGNISIGDMVTGEVTIGSPRLYTSKEHGGSVAWNAIKLKSIQKSED